MYICVPVMEAAASTVFMVWLRACSYFNRALRKIGNHRIIRNNGREIEYSVWKCMSESTQWNKNDVLT
jgi:hypothetical protein